MDPSDDDHNGEHLNVDYLITDIAQAGNSIYWFFTENLLENTDGVLRLIAVAGIHRSTPSLFSQGGSLLPSASADVRAILMTSSHSEGR